MVELYVIAPVEKPTEWVNAVVIASQQNGKLWICLDSRPLSKAIKKQHHCLPTIEGAYRCSVFLQARCSLRILANQSGWRKRRLANLWSYIRTFLLQTPPLWDTLCQWSLSSRSCLSHRLIAGLPGCSNSQDDIVVWGTTKQEQDLSHRDVLTRIRDSDWSSTEANASSHLTSMP